jgi:hypothetical protein
MFPSVMLCLTRKMDLWKGTEHVVSVKQTNMIQSSVLSGGISKIFYGAGINGTTILNSTRKKRKIMHSAYHDFCKPNVR